MTTLGLIILALLLVGFGLVYTGSRDLDGTAEDAMGGSIIALGGWTLVGAAVLLIIGAVFVRTFFT